MGLHTKPHQPKQNNYLYIIGFEFWLGAISLNIIIKFNLSNYFCFIISTEAIITSARNPFVPLNLPYVQFREALFMLSQYYHLLTIPFIHFSSISFYNILYTIFKLYFWNSYSLMLNSLSSLPKPSEAMKEDDYMVYSLPYLTCVFT